MRRIHYLATLAAFPPPGENTASVPPAPNGIEFPADYRNWRVISVSHRTDHHSMRAILGNDIAIEAHRLGASGRWR